MRESRKNERTQLPPDTFEEWVKAQAVRPADARRSKRTSEDSYESWVSKRVERRVRGKSRGPTSASI